MYSIDCNYYEYKFNTIEELIDDVLKNGIDPSYEVTRDGVSIGEELIDFMIY